MPTDIVMPQMGESIFEGTITKWLKKPGDKVQRDEPLFEISTDKVDAEIPAPASGVLQDIKVAEGATVQVNTVVGTISADGESAASKTASPPSQARKESTPAKAAPAPEPKADAPSAPIQPVHAQASHEEEDHARSSPLVRKIAREHNINLSQVPGTGLGGRITKQDITAFLEQGQPAAAVADMEDHANVRAWAGMTTYTPIDGKDVMLCHLSRGKSWTTRTKRRWRSAPECRR